VIRQEPAFAEMFIAHLLGRTIRVEADLVDQLFNSSEKRLARLLLLLAHFGKEEKPEPMIAKISQETLAEMIGTTRSRVSFFMNKFRKRLHSLQRRHPSPQFIVESRSAQRAAHRDLNDRILRTRGHVDLTADRMMWHVRNLFCDASNIEQSSP